jgi:hypothetical protein
MQELDIERHGATWGRQTAEKKSGRFLKKAAQKLLLLWAGDSETSAAQVKRVFCFFFSKKKLSFLLHLRMITGPAR